MSLRTFTPKAIPKNVPRAIPNIRTTIPGNIYELHPYSVSIPAAVVGPPTFPKRKSLVAIFSSFPIPPNTPRCVTICNKPNIILGRFSITLRMFPLAPNTANTRVFHIFCSMIAL